LSQYVFQMLVSLDLEQLRKYEKIYKKFFSLIENFFKSHLELAFLKFDHQILLSIIKFLIAGLNDE